ncbi:MAG: hypothetical protein ABI779_16000 [Acidobacteriota bacterium]
MISCESFRTRFHVGSDDAALLEHLRSCDRCLDLAAHSDPDVMFRALGGTEMIPPGGVEDFVQGVMQQVRVRGAESTVTASHVVAWPRQLAMAAAVSVAIFGSTLVYRTAGPPTGLTARAALKASPVMMASTNLTTKPVVETYESQNATIVEMPSEESDQVKIVMVFDENLPADL